MESKKEVKFYLIWIGNTTHGRDTVAMHTYLLHESIMSIQEDYYESGVLREDKREDLDYTHWSIDNNIVSPGGL